MILMKSFKNAAMKKYISFIAIAAFVAAGVVSCGKVEEEVINPSDVEQNGVIEESEPSVPYLTFALSNGESTKAVLGESAGKKYAEWEDNDKIGSITTKSNGYSSVDASSTPVTFKVFSSGGLSEGNTINLWYPYTTTQTNAAAVALSIPASQYQVGGVYDYSAMPMVAEQITVTAGMVSDTNNTPVDVVGFYNLGSLIDFKIFAASSYTTEKVLSVTFNASTAIAGDFTKDLTAVNASDESTLTISGYTATSVTTNVMPFSTVGTSKDTPLDVYMVVAPGTYTGTVVVVTDAATYTWTISSGKEFNRSSVKPLGLQLDKASATRVAHVKGSFSFNLAKASYNSASGTAASWSHGILSMNAAKASAGTATNNYMPPAQTSTRFYKNSSLAFVPGSLQIEKVVYTATSSTYATAFASSTWTNAKATADDTNVTVVPTDGSASFAASAVGNTTGATEVKVYFDNNTYTISSASDPVAGGTFTIKKGASDITSAKVNTTITLAATPNSGYTFSSWTVKDAENNEISVVSNEFQMPASNVTVTANFAAAAASKTISITSPSHGTVSTDPAGSAAPEATVTITATPDSGYEVDSISVVDEDSNPVAVTSNQFTMPDKNVTVTVTFIKIAYELTAGGWGTSYAVKTGQSGSSDYDNDMTWTITFGGNNSSMGANNANLSKCTLGDTYAKVGSPMSYTASTTYVTAAISESTMSNIAKVVVTTGSISGTINEVSLVCSSDDETYTQIGSTLTSKTDGKYTFEFTKKTEALYYAIVFKGTATSGSKPLFRIDTPNIKYYEK